MSLNAKVEFANFSIAGAIPLRTYCITDPNSCCGEEGVGSGPQVTGLIVEWTVFRIPRAALLTNGTANLPVCVTNPIDCCPGSSGSGSGLNDNGQGHGGGLGSGFMAGVRVQYTDVALPPGSKILGTYCLFSPVGCCTQQGSGSGSSGSQRSGSGSIIIDVCECIYPGKTEGGIDMCPPCDNVPSQVLVDISGLVEGTCGSCASEDLFATLSWVENSGGCIWTGSFPATTCFGSFEAQLQAVGGEWELLITLSSGKSVLWRLGQNSWNCCGTNSPLFISQDAGLACDFSKSTVLLLSCLDCCTNVCLYAGACGPVCPFGYSPAFLVRMVGVPDDTGCGSCSDYTEDQPGFYLISNASCEWILNPAPGELDCLGKQSVSDTSAPCLGAVLNVILDLSGDPLLIMQFENGTLTYQMPAAMWNCCGEENVFTGDMLVDQPDNLCDFTSNGFLVLVDACLNCCQHGGSSSSPSSSSGSASEITSPCCPGNPLPSQLTANTTVFTGTCAGLAGILALNYGALTAFESSSMDGAEFGWSSGWQPSGSCQIKMILTCNSPVEGCDGFNLGIFCLCGGTETFVSGPDPPFSCSCNSFDLQIAYTVSGCGGTCTGAEPITEITA